MTDVWHPFTQQQGFQPHGRVIRTQGPWLHLADGRRVFDGNCAWWVISHGHCDPRISGAIAQQAQTFDQVILADFTHGPAAQLTRTLAELAPGTLNHVFFSDDGSTAVEVALKMMWQLRGTRTKVLCFDGAYHGDTLGAMSVGARDVFSTPFHDLLFNVITVPWDDIPALEKAFAEYGSELSLAIIEPMLQGAAGMRFGSVAHLQALDRLCKAHGVPWIADEVATGFGRTGPMFAVEHAGVVPDAICLSKSITGGTLPLGVTIATDAIYQAFLGADKRDAFLHGHSYTGNPIACAAANAALAIYEEDKTLDRIQGIEAKLKAFASGLQDMINPRAIGGILAFEVPGGTHRYFSNAGQAILDEALARGLYLRRLGPTMYFMPPYGTEPAVLDWALGVLDEAIKAAAAPEYRPE